MQLLPTSVAEIENLHRLVTSFQIELFQRPVEFVVELTDEEEADPCRDFVWEITTDETSIMNIAAELAKAVLIDILAGFGHTAPITPGESVYDTSSTPYDFIQKHINLVQQAEEGYRNLDFTNPEHRWIGQKIAWMAVHAEFAGEAASIAFGVLRLDYQLEEPATNVLRELAEMSTEYAEFLAKGIPHT